MERIVSTIEARMSSSRLPGKVLMKILGRPVLELLVERLRRVSGVQEVVIATTVNKADDAICEFAKDRKIAFYRGSEEDVLERVLQAAKHYKADLIMEMTGDCPLLDPAESQKVVDFFMKNRSRYDYVSNILKRTYPRGLDTQIFPVSVLDEVARKTSDPADRENVSLYIYEHPKEYRCGNVEAPAEVKNPDLRLTLDTREDFELIKTIFERLYPNNPNFSIGDVMKLLRDHPEFAEVNRNIRQKAVR